MTQPSRPVTASGSAPFTSTSHSLAGLWCVIHTVATATTLTVKDDPAGLDPERWAATFDLAEALTEIEWLDPHLRCEQTGWFHEHGLDGVADAAQQSGRLIRAAIEFTAEMLADGDVRWSFDELIAISRVVHLLSRAYTRLTGQFV